MIAYIVVIILSFKSYHFTPSQIILSQNLIQLKIKIRLKYFSSISCKFDFMFLQQCGLLQKSLLTNGESVSISYILSIQPVIGKYHQVRRYHHKGCKLFVGKTNCNSLKKMVKPNEYKSSSASEQTRIQATSRCRKNQFTFINRFCITYFVFVFDFNLNFQFELVQFVVFRGEFELLFIHTDLLIYLRCVNLLVQQGSDVIPRAGQQCW